MMGYLFEYGCRHQDPHLNRQSRYPASACHRQRELQNLNLREKCKYYDALTFLCYKSTLEALDLCSNAPSQGDQPVAAHPQTA